jgi:ABC-type sugar transport system permease subunit
VGLTAAVLYLRIHNQAETALSETPAAAYAEALASAFPSAAQGPGELQHLMDRLRRSDGSLKLAALVAEPRSARYRFLRNRRYVAHSEARRVGQPLDPSVAGDKGMYDLVSRVRQQGAQLRTRLSPRGMRQAEAAVPIQVKGKHVATAIVITEPAGGAPRVPAWPIGAGVLVCTLLGLAAGGFLGPRLRYGLILMATAAVAMVDHLQLRRTLLVYGEVLEKSLGELARHTGVPAGHLAGHAGSLPGRGDLALALSALIALAVGLLGWGGFGRRATASLRQHRFAYGYIAPAALGMLLLVFVPFGYGLGLGFFDHAHGNYTYVGLRNFVEILSGGGRPITHPLNFYFTLGVTVLWTAANVLLHTGIGLGLALLLKDPLLGFKGVYRVLLILPWAVPNYITALIWKGMFQYQYGAVNHLLSLLGAEKVSWFSSFATAFFANVATNTWLGFPFMMVVSLGALQSIPRDLYEAAAVDGASRWQGFVKITLPLLRPALFPAIIFGSIWTFNMFNIIYLVSEGEPGGASDILITEAYKWAFERADRYGLAAAYATVIFVILLGYTLLANRWARATEDVYE